MRRCLAVASLSLFLFAVVPSALGAAGELGILVPPAAAGRLVSLSYSGTPLPPSPGCAYSEPNWAVTGPSFSAGGTGSTFGFTPPTGGLYQASVGIPMTGPPNTDCFGYAGYGRAEIYVYEPPKILGITTFPDPPIVDRETSVGTDDVFPKNATGWAWDFGDGKSCTDCGEHIWTNPGTYDLEVTISNPAGSDTATLRVPVKPDPPTAGASFEPSPRPKAGELVRFTANIGGGERDRTILWDFGDGTTSTDLNPSHTFAAADDYDVSLTVTNRWGSDTWTYSPLTVLPATGGSPPSSANFTFTPVSPVTGQRVTFVDQSTGSITRWRWEFDDGSPAEYVRNPAHTFTQWGRKNVGLYVSNAYGTKGIILFVDVLRDDVPPLAKFTWTPFRVSVGQTVQFSDESSGATSWLWDLGEDGATSTAQNPSYTYRTSGQKAVTLRASNAYGSNSVTKFFPCDESPGGGLEANFTWTPLQPNPGQEVQFLDLSGGSPEKWSWVVSDGAQSAERNWKHAFAAAGEYAVSLRVDRGTETKIRVQIVKVGTSAEPVPNFTWTPGSPEPNELVSFTNLSLNATSYAWNFDDGSTSTAVDPTHRFTEAKTYRVRLTAKSADGTSESLTKEVRVGSVEAVPVANFTATPNPARVGNVVRFNDTSTGRPTEWLWDFGYSNQTSRSQNPQHTFPFEGTFLVTLTASNSKGTSTPITLPVVIKNEQLKPAPDFTWSPGNPAAGQLVEFTDRSANEPKGWHWIFEDGGSADGASVGHTFARAGTWKVTLEASNEAGLATLTRSVVVSEALLQADFTIDPASPIVGQQVTFRDTSRGAPDSWQWIVDGVRAGTTRDLPWTFYEGGEHVIELQAMRLPSEKSIRQRAVVVAAPPVASFKSSGSLVTGSNITFTDTSSGSPTKWTWSIGGEVIGDRASVARSFKTTGYVRVRLFVENEAGSDSVTYGFEIRARASDRPKVVSVAARYGPCFYETMRVDDPMIVDLDWRSQSPDRLDLEINGVSGEAIPAKTSRVSFDLDSRRLDYTGDVTENRMLFTATSLTGVASEPQLITFFGVKTPGYLRFANVAREIDEAKRRAFTRGIYLPPEALDAKVRLPQFLGGRELGLKKVQFKLEQIFRTDCSVATNVEITGGLEVGPGYTGLKGSAAFEKKLSKTTGILASQELAVGLEGFSGFELQRSVVEAIPGMTPFCELPIVSDVCAAVKVKLEVQASLGGVAEFDIKDDGTLNFKGKNYTGELAIGASGAVGVGSAKLEFFGGGKGNMKVGRLGETPYFKKIDVLLEFGARFLWFGTLTEFKHGAACTYEPDKEFTCGENISNAQVPGARSARLSLRPVAPLSRREKVEDESASPPVLLRNVSPLADPAAAMRGERSVLVYLSENEASGAALQRLDVRAMKRSSAAGAWSAPVNITSDAMGDFNPTVVVTSEGRSVAAWERIRNAALSYADLSRLEEMPKLLREVEIAVSTSDSSSDAWSSPVVLTSNDTFDHQPSLAAFGDGRTMLVWLREPADGKSGQQIVARILQGDVWSPETVIASELHGVGELALVAKDGEAQLVVSRDRDGVATTNDHDLVVFVYRDGAWSAPRDVTADDADDRAPALTYDAGAARVYWTRAGGFVTRLLPDGPIETVRAGGDRAAVAQAVLATNPEGAQSVFWSTGSDLRMLLFDAEAKQWSRDILLTGDDISHGSLSASFTPDGLLHLITLGTVIEQEDVTRVIDGAPVVIPDVAVPGRSDLMSFDKALRVDLLAQGETIAVVPRTPNAGETFTFGIDLKNGGELPVREVRAQLQRGDTVLASTIVPGDWMPGEVRHVEWATVFDATRPELTVTVDPLDEVQDAVRTNNVARFTFANRAPAACFQASAGSGGNPLTVSFDAGCSVDADGSIARYAWSFSEGASVAGRNVAHTFATAGTQTVLLTITDDMGASATEAMTVDVASPTDWRRAEAAHSLHLPVVGRAVGVGGSYFVSDLALVNTDLGRDLDVEAVFLPDGRSDAYRKTITLGGGELLQTRDVVAQLFGATNGTGSLRLDLSHPHAVAVVRTYNDQPAGTAGFSNEGVPRGTALGDGEKGVILQHWLPGYRTNIGFTEVSGLPTDLTVTAFDESGAKLGSEVFALAPYDHTQVNGRALFQSRGRIEVEVKGGGVFAYASTVDGKTGDPIYQAAERLPATSDAQVLLIPVVARLAGVNDSIWRSDVRVFNPGSSSQTVSMELRTGAGSFTKAFELSAGETASFDDVITRQFSAVTGNVGGALVVSSSGPILASSRTFNIAAGGTYGLYVPARARDQLVGEGESAWLVQLQENATYRCNLGITSIDGPVEVSVRAFDTAGTTLATRVYGVAAGQNVQIGRVFADMGVALPLDAAGLEVTVTQGLAFIYASVNDNRTGDGTFIEARR